jgi:hypothetical protein
MLWIITLLAIGVTYVIVKKRRQRKATATANPTA